MPDMEAHARQPMQWLTIQVMLRAATQASSLFGLAEHLRAFFKCQHLEPLLGGGILQMTVPDKPTSPAQRYVLTNAGVQLKLLHKQQQALSRTA